MDIFIRGFSMTLWFTSDLHFFHNNVIRNSRRPFKNMDEMHETIITNWNKCVKKREVIYVLGDFSFGGKEKTKEILKRLNGHKILILGNHDRDAAWMLEAGFNKVYENYYININPGNQKVYLSHYQYHPGWWRTIKLRVMGWGQYLRYNHKRIMDDGNWLLHGHVHSKKKIWGERMIHVGVDAWDFKPISHTTILKIIKDNPPKPRLEDYVYKILKKFDSIFYRRKKK